MKHTTQELIDTAHMYFPRMSPRDPRYEHTVEAQRQRRAHEQARARYDTWSTLLDRLGKHFPKEQYGEVSVQELCLYLRAAGSPAHDRCFSGVLHLPVRHAGETSHGLVFRISFVVPYYSIHSRCTLHSTGYYARATASAEVTGEDTDYRESFDFSADELSFVAILRQEIEVAFPGYEEMPAEAGTTIVPGVSVGFQQPDTATLFDCLFSHYW